MAIFRNFFSPCMSNELVKAECNVAELMNENVKLTTELQPVFVKI